MPGVDTTYTVVYTPIGEEVEEEPVVEEPVVEAPVEEATTTEPEAAE